ncbi:hypothetical protein EAF04_004036 [Stromatinia cepivora]|nr:hypothetical protein EAF04_004036 [Stromatinia cepivora]
MNPAFEEMSGAIEWDAALLIVLMIYPYITLLIICILYDCSLETPLEFHPQAQHGRNDPELYRKCKVCLESMEKEPLENNTPGRTTTEYDHLTDVCLPCLQQSMSFLMGEGEHILKCPICSQDLEPWFIQLYRTKAMFTKGDADKTPRYCDFALQHYSRSQADFNWRLAPKCGSGQIHEGGNARMICGQVCEEFDDPGRKQREEEKKSLDKVQETTVACPRCYAPIEKNGGCSHVKCLSRNRKSEFMFRQYVQRRLIFRGFRSG